MGDAAAPRRRRDLDALGRVPRPARLARARGPVLRRAVPERARRAAGPRLRPRGPPAVLRRHPAHRLRRPAPAAADRDDVRARADGAAPLRRRRAGPREPRRRGAAPRRRPAAGPRRRGRSEARLLQPRPRLREPRVLGRRLRVRAAHGVLPPGGRRLQPPAGPPARRRRGGAGSVEPRVRRPRRRRARPVPVQQRGRRPQRGGLRGAARRGPRALPGPRLRLRVLVGGVRPRPGGRPRVGRRAGSPRQRPVAGTIFERFGVGKQCEFVTVMLGRPSTTSSPSTTSC